MTIDDLLKSRANGVHFSMLFALTEPHAAYPGKRPAPRVAIQRSLEALDGRTRDRLDTLATTLRANPDFDGLTPEESYMLRQRLLCSLDLLSRLADSLPTPEWLSTADSRLASEDHWLLIGIWKEFGPFWLQNLSWRLSRGHDG